MVAEWRINPRGEERGVTERSRRGLLPYSRREVIAARTKEVAVGEVLSCQISGAIFKLEQIGFSAGVMRGVREREASGMKRRSENLERQSSISEDEEDGERRRPWGWRGDDQQLSCEQKFEMPIKYPSGVVRNIAARTSVFAQQISVRT